MYPRFSNTEEGHRDAIKSAEAGIAAFIATGNLSSFAKAELQRKICNFSMTITGQPIEFVPCQDPPTPQGDAGMLVRKFR